MAADTTKYTEAIGWLVSNRQYLNLTGIAKHIGTDTATLTRVVKGEQGSRGYAVKLPEKSAIALDILVQGMKQ